MLNILEILNKKGEEGAFFWDFIDKIKGMPIYKDHWGEDCMDNKILDKYYASISRSLRLLKKLGFVQKITYVMPDETAVRGYLVCKYWVITEEGVQKLSCET